MEPLLTNPLRDRIRQPRQLRIVGRETTAHDVLLPCKRPSVPDIEQTRTTDSVCAASLHSVSTGDSCAEKLLRRRISARPDSRRRMPEAITELIACRPTQTTA